MSSFSIIFISEIIKTRLDPIPDFHLRFHEEDSNVLIILEVQKGAETPYYYSGDGVLETYIRVVYRDFPASVSTSPRCVRINSFSPRSFSRRLNSEKADETLFRLILSDSLMQYPAHSLPCLFIVPIPQILRFTHPEYFCQLLSFRTDCWEQILKISEECLIILYCPLISP